MIVAAHQPSYLPWLGYLDKMASADLFVIMDDVQYQSQNFQNRNRIKLNNGTGWLTVPVVRGLQSDRIMEKRIQNTAGSRHQWQRVTWLTLETHYRRAPYWDEYAAELRDLYSWSWDYLIDLDLALLELARRWFGVTTPLCLASSLGLSGQKTERIIELCKRVGASVYLSGSGGSSSYLDVTAMRRAGIEVRWQQFVHPVYPQRYPELGFAPYLGFLDLVLNCGPASRDIAFSRHELWQEACR